MTADPAWTRSAPSRLSDEFAPGSLDPKTYADIAAYLMSKNRVPVGTVELPSDPDALANITLPPLQ